MTQTETLKSEIVKIGKKLYANKFIAAYDGNISVRLDNNNFLTTPSGVCKGAITEQDILEINQQGEIVNGKGKPSSELRMHLLCYRLRPGINALIHAHPALCTALTIAGVSLAEPVIPEMVLTIGNVPTAAYATPTTSEVPESIENLIPSHDAVLLERHGTITLGKNLDEAYYKLEKLEHSAKTILSARQLAVVKPLTTEQVKKLVDLRNSYKQ